MSLDSTPSTRVSCLRIEICLVGTPSPAPAPGLPDGEPESTAGARRGGGDSECGVGRPFVLVQSFVLAGGEGGGHTRKQEKRGPCCLFSPLRVHCRTICAQASAWESPPQMEVSAINRSFY
jgi:hypothetical protein